MQVGELTLDVDQQRIQFQGREVQLEGNTWKVLYYLAEHAGQKCYAEDILRAVWGPAGIRLQRRADGRRKDYHCLNMTVYRLRQKLGDARTMIDGQSPGRLVPAWRRLRSESVPHVILKRQGCQVHAKRQPGCPRCASPFRWYRHDD